MYSNRIVKHKSGKYFVRCSILITIVFCCWALVACAKSKANPTLVASYDLPVVDVLTTATLPHSIRPIPSYTPTVMVLDTPTRSLTSTQKPTKADFTPYPVATLSEDELWLKFDILAESTNCSLPCWNDMTPSLSQGKDVQPFFARLTTDTSHATPYVTSQNVYIYSTNYLPSKGGPQVSVYLQQDIVSKIEITRMTMPEYITVERMFTTLGKPEIIRMQTGQGDYSILFYYPQRYTVIGFYGNVREKTTESQVFDICMSDAEFFDAYLYSEISAGGLAQYFKEWEKYAISLEMTDELLAKLQSVDGCIPDPNG